MAASTALTRFPSRTHSSFSNIISSVVPIQQCHYLLTSYTPFTSDNVEKAKISRKTTIHDVMRRLLQPKNILASLSPTRQSCFISAFNILRGQVDQAEVFPSRAISHAHMFVGQQKSNSNQGEEDGQFHTLGACRYSSCQYHQFIVTVQLHQCFRPADLEPHWRVNGTHFYDFKITDFDSLQDCSTYL